MTQPLSRQWNSTSGHDPDRELRELRVVGDLMQSEFSRVLEFIRQEYPSHRWDALPYEVGQAVLGGEPTIEAWTAIRRGSR